MSGQVVTGLGDEILTSSPLGSCIAVIAYDIKRKIGGIAHVMLPGSSYKTEGNNNNNKYAVDGINSLLDKLLNLKSQIRDIRICLIGGANVLRKEDDFIAETLVTSVVKIIGEKKIKICASSLGGFERRTGRIEMKTGNVFFTIGGSAERMLWDFNKNTGEKTTIEINHK